LQSELKLSGKGQGTFKLSGNGNECKPLQLGAVYARRDAVAGSSSFGRGFALLGFGGGCGGGGGGSGWGRGPSATRALSSSSGDGGGGGSSLNDKLRAARERRGPPRGEEVGGRGSSGASARGGGRGGGGGRGRGGAGGGRARAIALNGRISQTEKDPEGLLRLVGEELPNFSGVNMSTAFSKLGSLCGSRSFPGDVAAIDNFRRLMAQACAMCADGRLDVQAVANIIHAVSKMSVAGKLAAADANVQDMLTALEQQVVLVASNMASQNVSNTVYAFAVLGRTPGAQARAALEAAVGRVGGWRRIWSPSTYQTLRGRSRRWGCRRGLRRGRRCWPRWCEWVREWFLRPSQIRHGASRPRG